MAILNYSPLTKTFEYVDDEGNITVYADNELIKGISRVLDVGSKETESLTENFEEQLEAIQEAFEKKLKELQEELKSERELRTKAEKLNEHLQDEVSKLRGDLQRRDESNSWDTSGTYRISTVEVDPSGSKILTSGTYTISDWSTTTDDTV